MPATRSRSAPDAQSVTTAAESRTEDQARRLKHYLVTMTIRTACFVLLVVIDEWYRWFFAFGAVFLPFFAVVAANAVKPRMTGRVQPVLPTVDTTHLLEREAWHEPVVGSVRPEGPDGDRSAADR